MHLVLGSHVFGAGGPQVAAERHFLGEGTAPHTHGFIEIAIVLRGSAVHYSGTGRHHIASGSVALIRPGHWHGYERVDSLEVWNVYLGLELLAHELLGLQDDPLLARLLWRLPHASAGPGPSSAKQPDNPVLGTLNAKGLAKTLWALADLSTPASQTARRVGSALMLLSEVCSVAFPLLAGSGAPEAVDPRVVGARQLLDSRLDEGWTLARLADEVHLSPAYLSRLFHKTFGLPPLAYLSHRRAEQAAKLLTETDLSVAAVGRAVGWPDPNYMTRRFRLLIGVPPSRYRAIAALSGT